MPAIKQIEIRVYPRVRTVEAHLGLPGRKGEKGNPGIIVSVDPPPAPEQNDLWVQLPSP